MSLLSIHIRDKPSKRIFTPNRQLTRTSGVYFEDTLCECCSGTNCIFVPGMGVTHILFSNALYSLTPNKEVLGVLGTYLVFPECCLDKFGSFVEFSLLMIRQS